MGTGLLARGDSLADGPAGTALLHIEQSRCCGVAGADRDWIRKIARDHVIAHPDSASLYRGAPAVAFALHASAEPGYTSTLLGLDRVIEDLTRQRLAAATNRLGRGDLADLKEWDLISGLTGIAAQQLQRHPDGALLRSLLDYLVRLTQPVVVDGEVRPGWWCARGPDGRESNDWPGGHANLGMAHGIAGPLALLSIAKLHGVTVDGHDEAIDAICVWLDRWRSGVNRGAWWPGLISLTEWRTGTIWQTGPQRPSWCYGTPGIARALHLAAQAQRDPVVKSIAEAALVGCATDEQQAQWLSDNSLCHGWAGMVHTLWRACLDAPSNIALSDALVIARQRFETYLTGRWPDHDGLLEGSAGIELVRHETARNSPPWTDWDRCLLLA